MYDVIVVGAGFAGCVIARELAEKGKKVLILEKREQIGGNMYEYVDNNGIPIHKYGPHIFHTNSKKVFDYLKKFSEWFKYEHKVLGNIQNKLVPIPFNFTSLEMLFSEEKAKKIEEKLLSKYEKNSKISILDLINDTDSEINEFGKYVYENVFANYTAKQWEIPVSQIDKSVINRVPVVLGYDDRYFQDKYQYMPKYGFTDIFKNILDHDNISIQLNKDAIEYIKIDNKNNKILYENNEYKGILVYTGPIDEALDFEFGELPYRSINLKFESLKCNQYQTVAVVNYPNTEKFTRITEFKKFYPFDKKLSENKETVILKEYPIKYDRSKEYLTPYYVITNAKNLEIYNKYKDSVKNIKNLIFCGRLAEYKYYNMDAVIERALSIAEKIN